MNEIALVLVSALAGALLSALFALAPGLHIYNLMGLLAMGVHTLALRGYDVPPDAIAAAAMGMLVGYATLNTLPSVLLAAPDESALFTVLPGQKFLMHGRGLEAVMIVTLGGLCGLGVLALIVAPLAPFVFPPANAVLRPHLHWILWVVIVFILMSEWPKSGNAGQGGWARFLDGWKSTGAGLLTFALSSLLGFVLLYRSPVRAEAAFQNLMPAFVGLFTVPWLLVNIATRTRPPPQQTDRRVEVTGAQVAQGVFAGTLGGGFAAFFPVITGGIGGLLAGHATALRNDRVFLISQGASKMIYYVGGLLFFFVPTTTMTRGGAAGMLRTLYRPHGARDYALALAALALAGAATYFLVRPLSRLLIVAVGRWGYRTLSWLALAVSLALVIGVTGWAGLLVMAVASGIGLIPVLFGSRRMNCLGVILVPVACNMSGVGATVAGALGLLH